jgi:hypothetical protein
MSNLPKCGALKLVSAAFFCENKHANNNGAEQVPHEAALRIININSRFDIGD